MSIDPSVSALLARVSCFLSGQGIKAYLTGGFVRDRLMERAAGDIDSAVDGDAYQRVRVGSEGLEYVRNVPRDSESGTAVGVDRLNDGGVESCPGALEKPPAVVESHVDAPGTARRDEPGDSHGVTGDSQFFGHGVGRTERYQG